MLRKRIAMLERRRDLSLREFDTHWRTGHAEFITELPGLKEYVQNSVIARWEVGEPGGVDGIVEVWFDDGAVTSPDQHTSLAQQDDEVTFIRTLTAFTVTDRRSYDADEKIWILSPTLFDGIVGMVWPPNAIIFTPEPEAVLMERPRLQKESAPPRMVVILPVDDTNSKSVFDVAVAAFTENGAPEGLRVVHTRTRRIR